jgi:translation initiation factor eIF-2B subunit epsilon
MRNYQKSVLHGYVFIFLLFILFPSQACAPIASATLLDYTIEWLARTPVARVLLVTATHAHNLKAYVTCVSFNILSILNPFSRWSPVFTAGVQIVECEGAMSNGDLVRELDRRALITNDVLITHAGVVCTSDLRDALDTYRWVCVCVTALLQNHIYFY